MTRKQAIKKATKHLETLYFQGKNEDAELCEVIQILKELQNGFPVKIWDDITIRGEIDRFITENGRPPKVKELDTIKYLPPHPVITLQYGMTAGEWLRQNYPSSTYTDFRSRYAGWTKDTFKTVFIQEYERIKPRSRAQYEKERDKSTPSTKYLCKILGISTWTELLEKYHLKKYAEKEKVRFVLKRHIEIE